MFSHLPPTLSHEPLKHLFHCVPSANREVSVSVWFNFIHNIIGISPSLTLLCTQLLLFIPVTSPRGKIE
jgi:hypothetical protein